MSDASQMSDRCLHLGAEVRGILPSVPFGSCVLKVGSYEDFFPVALVLGGKNPMDHNF
jgi:hypothetical protein